MIVVQACSVAQNEVAVDCVGREPSLRILDEVIDLVVVLHEFLHPKPPGVTMRVSALIVPRAANPWRCGGPDQGDCFGDDIQTFRLVASDANLGLSSELNI